VFPGSQFSWSIDGAIGDRGPQDTTIADSGKAAIESSVNPTFLQDFRRCGM
jgi:hypothetical protein